jgi:NADPH:quinone reductase-like Zn-dependent oxidoreductase
VDAGDEVRSYRNNHEQEHFLLNCHILYHLNEMFVVFKVWTALPENGGGLCDLIAVEGNAVSKRPRQLHSAAAAACLPYAGLSALQWSRKVSRVAKEERILLIGATSPTGLAFLQIFARVLDVVAVCWPARTATLANALGVGAVAAFDPTGESEEDEASAAAELMLAGAEPATFTVAVVADSNLLPVTFIQRYLKSNGSHLIHEILSCVDRKNLETLSDLVDEGKLRPAYDGQFVVEKAEQAMALLANKDSAVFGQVALTFET